MLMNNVLPPIQIMCRYLCYQLVRNQFHSSGIFSGSEGVCKKLAYGNSAQVEHYVLNLIFYWPFYTETTPQIEIQFTIKNEIET